MAYWIDVRYPPIREDRLDRLYFHKGKRKLRMAKQMSIGDEVLYYESLTRPDPLLRGSQTLFAHVTVEGALKPRPPKDVRIVGNYIWNQDRQAKVLRHLPDGLKHLGVPLSRVRDVLGNRPMFGMEVTAEQFWELAAELEGRIERTLAADADG